MRICFIEDTPLHGGTQIWVTEATEEFIKKGHDITIIAPENSWITNECKKKGAKIVPYNYTDIIKGGEKELNIWGEGLSDCDVAVCTIHPPREDFHCSVFGARAIKSFDLDTILIPKTGTIVPEYSREFYLPDPEINSHVITITDFTRKYLIKNYNIPPDGIELIYQGTDISSFNPSENINMKAEKIYSVPKNSFPVIGCVGSFEHRKGQPVLLEALKKMIDGPFPGVHLLMVGDGPDEEMLKQKTAELGLTKNITFFPFTREPVYIYGRINILTLPSLYKEGLPNVLLEAMAMGIPVVASDLAGVPELVLDGKTGFKTIPGDVNSLFEKLVKLASDPDGLKAIGAAAKKFVTSDFDKGKQFNIFLEFFSGLKNKSLNR